LDQPNIQRLQYLTLFGTVTARNAGGQVIATLIDNWPCYEGYGSIAFDYSGPFNLLLGNGDTAASPDWQVSTILKPPDFIDVTPAIPMTQADFLLQPQLDPLVRIQVVQTPRFSIAEQTLEESAGEDKEDIVKEAKKPDHTDDKASSRKARKLQAKLRKKKKEKS
jgi:hypothetical protein